MNLDAAKISALLGKPTSSLMAEVDAVTSETLNRLSEQLNRPLERPDISYDLKGTTAGKASRDGKRVMLNLQLLNDPRHHDDMLHRTLPHELAHIAVRQVWGRNEKPHGYKWQYVMALLGLPADRCHNYEAKPARQRKKVERPFVYLCDCDTEHHLTAIRHRRIVAGTHSYRCNFCGVTLHR